MTKAEVLLVDDDEVDRELIIKSLAALELNITQVASGKACLDALVVKKYGLILLDYKLPDMDGLEVIQKIKQIDPELPIIIITGFGSEDLVIVSSNLGVLDYIPKNKITPEFLTRTILNDMLIHKSQQEKKRLENELEKQRNRDIEALSEIIRLAKEKLDAYQ